MKDINNFLHFEVKIYVHEIIITENTIIRLAFHDCLRYSDGTGGCDGCLNWDGMGFRFKNFFTTIFPDDEVTPEYYYTPQV